MKGKKGVILGVADGKSVTYGIAKACMVQRAKIAFTYLNDALKKGVGSIATGFGSENLVYSCDASKPEEIKALKESLEKNLGEIDFIVHSIAFTPREGLNGRFYDISKETFDVVMDVSVYSLIEVTRELGPLLSNGSSISALSHYGGVKYVPSYDFMGVTKAALKMTTKYLVEDLGKDGVRVSAINAGPIRILAAAGIDDFRLMLRWDGAHSPLKENVSIDEVGSSGMYLLSGLSNAIAGEIRYVDGGYSIMRMPAVDFSNEKPKIAWNGER